MFVDYDIKVVKLVTNILKKVRDRSENLGSFAPILKKMKYLEELKIEEDLNEGLPPMELFTTLPIKELSSYEFDIRNGRVKESVEIISRIKSLENFTLMYFASEDDYKLSPKDLTLFKDLPINGIWLGDLNVTPKNLMKFRKVLMEMKIIHMYKPFQSKHRIINHGPNGIYKTI